MRMCGAGRCLGDCRYAEKEKTANRHANAQRTRHTLWKRNERILFCANSPEANYWGQYFNLFAGARLTESVYGVLFPVPATAPPPVADVRFADTREFL
jgi:hypothetical protein